MSHLKILKDARDNNLDYVVVVEDDICFTQPEMFNVMMKNFLEKEFIEKVNNTIKKDNNWLYTTNIGNDKIKHNNNIESRKKDCIKKLNNGQFSYSKYEYENNAPQEDIDIFIEYGQDMVQFNDYALGTGPDLLYPVNGDACDWMYGEAGIFSYTPEIGGNSDGFWPATQRILPLAEENLYPNQVLALNAGSK